MQERVCIVNCSNVAKTHSQTPSPRCILHCTVFKSTSDKLKSWKTVDEISEKPNHDFDMFLTKFIMDKSCTNSLSRFSRFGHCSENQKDATENDSIQIYYITSSYKTRPMSASPACDNDARDTITNTPSNSRKNTIKISTYHFMSRVSPIKSHPLYLAIYPIFEHTDTRPAL